MKVDSMAFCWAESTAVRLDDSMVEGKAEWKVVWKVG